MEHVKYADGQCHPFLCPACKNQEYEIRAQFLRKKMRRNYIKAGICFVIFLLIYAAGYYSGIN